MPSYIVRNGRTVKRNPRQPWRASRKQVIESRTSFKPEELPKQKTGAQSIFVSVNRAMNRLKSERGLEDYTVEGLTEAVFGLMPPEKALDFVRAHANAYCEAVYGGRLGENLFGEKVSLRDLATTGKQKSSQRLRDRLSKADAFGFVDKWFDVIKKHFPEEKVNEEIAKAFWFTVNRLVEAEAEDIMANYRKNAFSYMEHRGFKMTGSDGKPNREASDSLDSLIEGQRFGILSEGVSFQELEQKYVKMRKNLRKYQFETRRRIRKAVFESAERNALNFQGEKLGFSRKNPNHARLLENIVEILLDKTVSGNLLETLPIKKLHVREETGFDRVLSGWADKEIKKALGSIAGEMREKQRLAEKAQAPQANIGQTREQRRHAQEERHLDAEARRALEALEAQDATQKGTIIKPETPGKPKTTFESLMDELKEKDAGLHGIISGLHVEGIVSEDFARRIAGSPAVRKRARLAVDKGFMEQIGPKGVPVLIYTLSLLKGRFLQMPTFNGWMGRCPYNKRLKHDVVNFLLREQILQKFHDGNEIAFAQPGRLRRIRPW